MSSLVRSAHWLEIAENRAESASNPKLYIALALGGGLVAGSLLNPLTALVALAWGAYCAWQANEHNSDQIEAVEDGLIAHLLDRKQLQQYANEVGAVQVQQELQSAIARELPLSEAATLAAKRLKLDTTGKRTEPLWALPPTDAATQQAASIGPNTRLTALEAVAAPIPESPVDAIAHTQPDSPAEDLTQPVQNSLIIGKPGSGKGILLSNALRAVQRREPGRTIYVIDPKADPLEQPYWAGCDAVASKCCQGLMPLEIWEWVGSCIREFQLVPGPKLLVIDEIRFLSNTFARINGKPTKALDTFWYIVESFTSLGDATGSHVWGVSQSSHTADLKISGGSLGQFRVMAIVNTADFGFYDTLKATNIVNPHPDEGHLREVVAARSPVHRVYYDSKFRKWFPLPQMENYSGRDRDKGTETPAVSGEDLGTSLQLSSDRQNLDSLWHESSGETTEDKVISYLQEKGEFLPSHQIKSAVAELKKMTAEEVRNFLHRMADENLIARKIKGLSVLFGATVT